MMIVPVFLLLLSAQLSLASNSIDILGCHRERVDMPATWFTVENRILENTVNSEPLNCTAVAATQLCRIYYNKTFIAVQENVYVQIYEGDSKKTNVALFGCSEEPLPLTSVEILVICVGILALAAILICCCVSVCANCRFCKSNNEDRHNAEIYSSLVLPTRRPKSDF